MKRKALWVLVGVFVLGVGTGVFLDRFCVGQRWGEAGIWRGKWAGSPEKRQARLLNSMTRKLELSEAQRAQIEPILRNAWSDVAALGLAFVDSMEQVLQQSADHIRSHLQPEQVETFDQIMEKFRRRSQQWRQRLGQTEPSS